MNRARVVLRAPRDPQRRSQSTLSPLHAQWIPTSAIDKDRRADVHTSDLTPAKQMPERPAFTCPMHPEVRQDGPGSCPVCGMALETVIPSGGTPKTEYTCPMHPEIVRSAPGSCPICGMALEPRTVTLDGEENLELRDMSRRLSGSGGLGAPALFLALGDKSSRRIVGGLASAPARSPRPLALS